MTDILDKFKIRRVDEVLAYIEVSGATPGTRTADIMTVDEVLAYIEVSEDPSNLVKVDEVLAYIEVSGTTPGTRTADIMTVDEVLIYIEVTENSREESGIPMLLSLGVGSK